MAKSILLQILAAYGNVQVCINKQAHLQSIFACADRRLYLSSSNLTAVHHIGSHAAE